MGYSQQTISAAAPPITTQIEIGCAGMGREWETYTHPTEHRKIGTLDAFAPSTGRTWAERESAGGKIGGRQEARTPDLRVANAALSQLS